MKPGDIYDASAWCIIWVRKHSTQPTITSDILEDCVDDQLTRIRKEEGHVLLVMQHSDLLRFQDLMNQRDALKEACLNAIGFIGGHTVLTKELVLKRLSDAVKPLLK